MTADTEQDKQDQGAVEMVPHVQKVLQEIAAKEGFSSPRLDVSPGSSAGDNYIGLLYRVVISEGEGASERQLSVIAKSVPMSAKRREMCGTERIFQNEGIMYNEVLPAYTALLQDKGLLSKGKDVSYPEAPKCLLVSVGKSAGAEDLLVLQDMRPLGFAMVDRRQGMPPAHCRLVFSALARLHACSFALEHTSPDRFRTLRESVREVLFCEDTPMREHFGPLTSRAYGMIEDRYPEGSEGFQKVKAYLDDFFNKSTALVAPNPDGGNVICHGDCWTNNLLFKNKEGTDQPESVCLLDFQVSRYCPPVLDLLYFGYTCTEKEMRDEHMDGLMRGYHAELLARMAALGVPDPTAVYSWDRMQADLRQRGSFAFALSVFTIPLFLTEKEEAVDMDAIFEEGDGDNPEKILEKFTSGKKSATALINKRISDVLQDVLELGYL